MKALIVDDSTVMRKIVDFALRSIDYVTVEAGSVTQALKQLEVHPDVELITLDWNMPGARGPELIDQLRADERLRDISVIMLSSQADQKSIAEAHAAGAIGFLSKPFNIKGLPGEIRRQLDRAGK